MILLLCADISETNQYIQLLSDAYQKAGHQVILGVDNFFHSDFKPAFVHVQWPEALYKWKEITDESAITPFKSRLAWFTQRRIPIVATFHNTKPHDYDSQAYKSVYEILYGTAQIIVHHGKASIELLKRDVPGCQYAQHIVCPHGPYPFEFFDPATARRLYGIPQQAFVLLNFGRQRAYKGHDFIKHVFKKWQKKAFLFTIGPKSASMAHLSPANKLIGVAHQKLSSCPSGVFPALLKNKLTLLQDISHNEIPAIMAGSDVLFSGHTSGLNSGLLSLAASYSKPVVFPDIGNFKEQLNGWPWSEPYEVGNADSAINALDRI
ncbi:MAG: hypothetical protein SVR04_15510, partial [Spirochaetota bacterium]|nr:hypothetical protein [Spirochaetota bacterium]